MRVCQLPGHQSLPGEESWKPWVGSQGPGELLPDDTPLSAEAVFRAGWAVNAFRAGSQIPTSKEQDARLTGRWGRGGRAGCPTPGAVDALK